MALGQDRVFRIPVGWLPSRTLPRDEVLRDLAAHAKTYQEAGEAVGGLYQRICSYVRAYGLDRGEVSAALRPLGFPSSRISEILRVASAPENLFREFVGGSTSFRVVLHKTRMWRQVRGSGAQVRWRNCRRAAGRMLQFLEKLNAKGWTYRLRGWHVEVREANITNIVRLNTLDQWC